MELQSWLEGNTWRFLLAGLGLLFFSVGIYQIKNDSQVPTTIELPQDSFEASGSSQVGSVVVDVAGAVVHPGVYRVSSGMRLAEVLQKAGGFQTGYDSEWVGKSLNQAAVVIDGQKIYIPFVHDDSEENEESGDENRSLNVNDASQAELEQLPGIGEVRAKSIIDSRPYANFEELVEKTNLPSNVVEKVKDKISFF